MPYFCGSQRTASDVSPCCVRPGIRLSEGQLPARKQATKFLQRLHMQAKWRGHGDQPWGPECWHSTMTCLQQSILAAGCCTCQTRRPMSFQGFVGVLRFQSGSSMDWDLLAQQMFCWLSGLPSPGKVFLLISRYYHCVLNLCSKTKQVHLASWPSFPRKLFSQWDLQH